jgi:hypothetical protein
MGIRPFTLRGKSRPLPEATVFGATFVKKTFVRERPDKLRRLLDCVLGRRTMANVVSATKPRLINSMSPLVIDQPYAR